MPAAILFGFGPALGWLWFVHGKDDLEPEPRRLVLLVFGCGCCAALATLALRPTLELLLPWQPLWWHDAVDAFVVTATVEEALKMVAFAGAVLWRQELDEPMDGIVYGAAAGLGFAAVENTLYLAMTGNASLILARAFTATLAHVACSGIAGLCLGLLRFPPRRWMLAGLGCLSAIVMHGAYDWFLLASSMWWLALLGALPLMLVLLASRMRWARRRSARFHPRLAARQAAIAALRRSSTMPTIAASVDPPSTPNRT